MPGTLDKKAITTFSDMLTARKRNVKVEKKDDRTLSSAKMDIYNIYLAADNVIKTKKINNTPIQDLTTNELKQGLNALEEISTNLVAEKQKYSGKEALPTLTLIINEKKEIDPIISLLKPQLAIKLKIENDSKNKSLETIKQALSLVNERMPKLNSLNPALKCNVKNTQDLILHIVAMNKAIFTDPSTTMDNINQAFLPLNNALKKANEHRVTLYTTHDDVKKLLIFLLRQDKTLISPEELALNADFAMQFVHLSNSNYEKYEQLIVDVEKQKKSLESQLPTLLPSHSMVTQQLENIKNPFCDLEVTLENSDEKNFLFDDAYETESLSDSDDDLLQEDNKDLQIAAPVCNTAYCNANREVFSSLINVGLLITATTAAIVCVSALVIAPPVALPAFAIFLASMTALIVKSDYRRSHAEDVKFSSGLFAKQPPAQQNQDNVHGFAPNSVFV